MRKHDVRKWLHAILDLLPVIIIPVFMIYSHRHTIDSYEVTRDKYEVVNFNQLVSYRSASNITSFDNVVTYTALADVNNSDLPLTIPVTYVNNHQILCKIDLISYDGSSSRCDVYFNTTSTWTNTTLWTLNSNYTSYSTILSRSNATSSCEMRYMIFGAWSTGFTFSVRLQMFDLTYMFGVGNEPSVELFNSWYTDDYYSYNTGTKQLLNTGTETFNDTDIGSQLLYAMYNPVDKYFNFNKVGTFNSIYQWFSLNFFNGNPPLVTPIIWNIILYEFIMDILFLIYVVFMFIIDFVECALDKAFGKSYRGGR